MNIDILDTITAAFVGALQTGIGALNQYSLALLGAFALIALYVQLGPLLASGGMGVGDALAAVLLTAIKMGIFYWLLVNLAPLATAAFLTFAQWGVAPTGGAFSP